MVNRINTVYQLGSNVKELVILYSLVQVSASSLQAVKEKVAAILKKSAKLLGGKMSWSSYTRFVDFGLFETSECS